MIGATSSGGHNAELPGLVAEHLARLAGYVPPSATGRAWPCEIRDLAPGEAIAIAGSCTWWRQGLAAVGSRALRMHQGSVSARTVWAEAQEQTVATVIGQLRQLWSSEPARPVLLQTARTMAYHVAIVHAIHAVWQTSRLSKLPAPVGPLIQAWRWGYWALGPDEKQGTFVLAPVCGIRSFAMEGIA